LVFLVALCTSAVQTTCGYFVSSLPRSAAYRDLHSFPTRRSSDLPSRDVGSPPKSGRPFTLVGLGIGFRFRVRLGEHRLSDPVGRILVNPVLRSRSDTVHEEPVGTIGRNLHSVADLAAFDILREDDRGVLRLLVILSTDAERERLNDGVVMISGVIASHSGPPLLDAHVHHQSTTRPAGRPGACARPCAASPSSPPETPPRSCACGGSDRATEGRSRRECPGRAHGRHPSPEPCTGNPTAICTRIDRRPGAEHARGSSPSRPATPAAGSTSTNST